MNEQTQATRRVLVTGAAKGVGRAMTDLFREQGATVVAVDIDEKALAALPSGDDLVTVRADVSVEADVQRALDVAGAVDVLCNNVGVIDRLTLIDEVERSEWDRLIAINLTAPFLFCRGMVPRMVAAGGGVIINVASVSGLAGARAGVAYTASKFGVVGLTKNIAATFADRGIRCNVICPGRILTGIADGIDISPGGVAVMTRDRDIPPEATPEQIAAVAGFLASDAASYVNGAAIPVDAGWTAY
jgi:NAD(P)-dependent dehydrogenase (short-subunit alcohol dehydrogenase family)